MSKNKKSVLLELRKRRCYDSVVNQLWRRAVEQQWKHNEDMEKKFTDSKDFGAALAQQQFKHGLLHALQLFDSLSGVTSSVVFLGPDSLKSSKCFISSKTRKLFKIVDEFLTENKDD